MKAAEVHSLSTNELRTRLNDTREEFMNLRFQMAMGGLTDYTRLRQTRRDIARMLTELNSRDAAAQQEGEV